MSREAVPKGVGVHGRLGLAQRAAIEDPPHVPWGESPPTQVEEQIRRVGSGRAVGGFEAGPTPGVPAVDRIDGQLVYTLKTPFKYGNAELTKFTISKELIDGHLKSNIGYKKAFALLPASNTLKKDKEEAKEQAMYWRAWTVKKTDLEARVQSNELENKTIVGCSWSGT